MSLRTLTRRSLTFRQSLIAGTSCCCHRSGTRPRHLTASTPAAVPEVAYNSNQDLDRQAWLGTVMSKPFQEQQPLVVRGAVSDTPAIDAWKSWDYWQETVGHEIAQVEIGGSYANTSAEQDEGSSRAEIPVEAYLQYLKLFEERFGRANSNSNEPAPKPEEMVYMAQNDLFSSLYKDIMIPEFCQEESSYMIGLGRLYSVMLWLGPRQCVSPLHNDPLDNFLMQFVGRKKLLLFPLNTQVYAGHEGQQPNTSPIEPLTFDKERYPLFDPTLGMTCEIGPGDALFIPSKWWHYAQSLETSASVNVWWR